MAVLKLFVIACTLLWSLPAISAENGSAAPVKNLNAALIRAMQGGAALGLDGRYRVLAPVIDEEFALPLMARIAAGRYWTQMSPAQKKLYLEKYRQWSIITYASRFDNYRGQKFETSEVSSPAARSADVDSTFINAEGERILFGYKVVLIDDKWQIADVRVKGVSQLALTRTQFVDILHKKGFDSLISKLDEKIADMAKGGKSDLDTGNSS